MLAQHVSVACTASKHLRISGVDCLSFFVSPFMGFRVYTSVGGGNSVSHSISRPIGFEMLDLQELVVNLSLI